MGQAMKILCLILSLIISSTLYAGTIDPNQSDLAHIQYGAKHECVAKITGTYKKDNKTTNFFASSVIIKPRIFLTAAHIVDGATDIFIVDNSGNKIPVKSALYLDRWDSNKVGPHDIAIGLLEKDIQLAFYPTLYEKDDEVGKTCSLAGFGITGNYMQGSKISDDKKRAGSNIIDEIFNGMLSTSVGNKNKTSLEFLIAHGDSGGGLFIDQKLAGIHSGIMTEDADKNLNSDYKDQAAHTRISSNKKWIDEMIKKLETLDRNN
jgi:hypothetical protein